MASQIRGSRLAAVALGALCTARGAGAGLPPVFEHVVIDPANPSDPHCKTLGDFSGDGLLDAVVASSSGDGMFWYEYPDWTKHAIRESGSWTTDMQAADLDDDGDPDLVLPNASGLYWYENPRPGGDPRTDPWIEHLIGAAGADHHDVEVADVDLDGDLDVVSRRKGGGSTIFWRQATPTSWTPITVSTSGGEGVGLGDLDGDDDVDVAQNGTWVEQLTPTSWTEHSIDASWPADVGAAIADVNGDGSADVVLAPSESTGRLSWYEADDPVNGPWTEHSIDPSVSYLHTFEVADMDGDGDLDVITAEMHQSSDPDEVSVYLNEGGGLSWSQLVVAESGSHNVRVGDIGDDGDLDIFGANWNDAAPNSAVVELWEQVDPGPLPLDLWRRHILETSLPWQAVFVDAKDLNGDNLPDLVTGGWWYPNPGDLGRAWTRTAIGEPFRNLAVVHDFDGDGDQDLLGTDGQPSGEDFLWARNSGSGQFTLFDITNGATGGDFLQGAWAGQLIAGGALEVLLSWHAGTGSTWMFSVPADPTTTAWPLATLSSTTNNEQMAVADFDGDRDLDVHLGSEWLRQDAGGLFTTRPGVAHATGVPDRVVAAPLDDDGDVDVVVGLEFANRLVWGENGGVGGWTEHVIATDFDYFSVDAADMDGDGDVDVVGGAHQGNGEVSIYENDGTGSSWVTHVVDPGDTNVIDHHDGTRLVDLDLDGDLDIVSIGWTRRSLVVYENLAIGDGDVVPPVLQSVVAVGAPNEVVVDFSEPLDEASAETASHYSISHGVTVSGAVLAANERTVRLATSTLSEGITYTLGVEDVEDLAGNSVVPGTQAEFDFVDIDPAAGLVAHWPLDEGGGTSTVDASGNGHTGILVNGPEWIPGPALDFDGADDYVDTGTFDVPGSELTLAAWILPEDLENCSSHDCRILSKATGIAEDAHWFMLSTIDSGATRLRFRLKAGGSTTTLIASSGDLVEGVWQHAAAVYDGSEMRLYLDGVLVGQTGKGGSVDTNPAVPVWIGGNPAVASEKPWDGVLDDLRVYDRALTADEILALPGPSQGDLFADGFESGDTSRWDATVD